MHQLRVGANPYGAYRATLLKWNGEDEEEEILEDEVLLDSTSCWRNETYWYCDILIGWRFLPANMTRFQMIHAHVGYDPNGKSKFSG